MRTLTHLDQYRVSMDRRMGDEKNGAFMLRLEGSNLTFAVIASDGGDWDHVSVSTESRCPRWHEMCIIKDMFFEPTEIVMQLHSDKNNHSNRHPYCLHLWRPQKERIPMPPISFV